ncbi:MAG TPA: TaqI-like C-terminal specificity domain-containing protein, partial [Candidatus Lokiarchaeia archaeon]|nr:TaqI-like C-terminal specificity domain-containing protein [Candidatus Lokiarchaeia archaeon]
MVESAGDPSEYQRLQSICKGFFPILDHYLGLTHLASITKQLPTNAFLSQDEYFNLHPFHWIAEFPEVLLARGGFDVIVGNPPYITMKKQTLGQKAIYAAKYRAFHANGDMYYLFVERSFALLHPRGTLSYIIPRYFLKAPTAVALKKFLASKGVTRIYDFGQSVVFQGVGVHTLMLFAHPSIDSTDSIKVPGVYSKEDFDAFQGGLLSAEQVSFTPADLQQENWLFLTPSEQQVFAQINQDAAGQLDEFCILSKGLQTGKDEVFVIDDATRVTYDIEPGALRPFLKGSGVQRFSINPPEPLFLIFSTSHHGDEVMSFPHAAAYLTEHRTELEDRTRVPAWYQWRLGDERVTLHWEDPKIVTASRGSENIFALDRAGYYFSQDVTFIQTLPEFDPYLQYFLALLNSTVTRMLMRWQFKELAEDVYEIFPEQLRKIPVKIPDSETLTRINVIMQEIENIAP